MLLSWALALAVSVSTAVWPGDGGGEGRSGAAMGAGPLHLRWQTDLDVGRSAVQSPILVPGVLVAWSADGVVRTWELPSLEALWDEKWGRAPVSCWGGNEWLVVSMGHPKKAVLGVDLRSGDTRWRAEDIDASCPPLAVGGVVVVGTRNGDIVAFRLPDGRQLWRTPVTRRSVSGIAVLGHRLVAAGLNGEVACLDEGHVAWRRDLGDNCYGGPAVAGDTVVCTTYGGWVTAYRANGTRLWSRNLGQHLRSRACVGNGSALVSGEDGVVYALGLRDGRPLWQRPLGGVLVSSPSLVGNEVVVGSLQGRGWVLDLSTGAVRDSIEVKGGLRSQPAVGGGFLAWCSDDGRANLWKIAGQPDPSENRGGSVGCAPAD